MRSHSRTQYRVICFPEFNALLTVMQNEVVTGLACFKRQYGQSEYNKILVSQLPKKTERYGKSL